jgi:hypothetical protein
MVLGVSTIARRRPNRKAAAERGEGAIVIGEYERAFYGNQYVSMAPLFEHYGIQLWLPGQAPPSAGANRSIASAAGSPRPCPVSWTVTVTAAPAADACRVMRQLPGRTAAARARRIERARPTSSQQTE